MLFNEPKLLKYEDVLALLNSDELSVLFNEPKLLKYDVSTTTPRGSECLSVLFNEPKLLKWRCDREPCKRANTFQCSSTSRNC